MKEVLGYLLTPTYTKDDYDRLSLMIDYLKEAGVSDEMLINMILNDYVPLSYKELPDFLWNDSLLKKNRYYHHHALQLTSKQPTFDPITFTFKESLSYFEMRICFTAEDILAYYHLKFPVQRETMASKNLGGIKYLLNHMPAMLTIGNTQFELIDFLLYVIDCAQEERFNPFTSFLEVFNKNSSKAYEQLASQNLSQQKKIILRTGEDISCGTEVLALNPNHLDAKNFLQ